MGALKPWHIAVLVVVLILLFGAKRLPDAARSLGRSLRIIKAETKGLPTTTSTCREGRRAGRPPAAAAAAASTTYQAVAAADRRPGAARPRH